MTTLQPPPPTTAPSGEATSSQTPLEKLDKKNNGPVQAVCPAPAQISWFYNRQKEPVLSKEKEQSAYYADSLYRDVFGVRPLPNSIQEIEIFDSVELVDFFPSFENTAFKDLALENCVLTYFPEKIAYNAPGLYFRTDLILGGLLDGPLDFFKHFLSESHIVIRLSAFLGFTLERDTPFHFDEIVLAGYLGGVRFSYPAGVVFLEVVSAGVRVTFQNNKDKKKDGKRSAPTDSESPESKRLKAGSGAALIPSQDEKHEPTGSASGTKPDLPPQDMTGSTDTSTAKGSKTTTDPNNLVDIGSGSLKRPSGPVTDKVNVKPDTTHQDGKSSFTAEIFGNVLLNLPFGRAVPLRLEYTAQYASDNIHFDMVLSEGDSWDHLFGIEGFNVWDVVVTADIPTKSANKAFAKMAEKGTADEGFACKVQASWEMGSKICALKGEIHPASEKKDNPSYIEGIIECPTFHDLRMAAKKLHGYECPEPQQEIHLESLRLRVDFTGKFAFYGKIKVDQATYEACIVISRGGIFISGKAESVRILDTDFFIQKASLDLFIAKRDLDEKGDTAGASTGTGTGEAATESIADEGTKANDDAHDEKVSTDDKSSNTTPKSAGKTSLDEAKRNASLSAVPAEKAASDANTTETPATTKTAAVPKKQTGWFFGCKIYGVLVLPYGPKDLDGDYKFKFVVTLTFTYSRARGAEVLVAGKARSTVSLRDICGDAIKEGGPLDAQLSDLTFMGTNSDDPDIPAEISRFPVKKGFFLCAILNRVPLLEDKDQKDGGKVLKKSTATDRAYMRIGYQKGDKIPKISIFLPPSFKVELGDRFYTGAIYLELDAKADPICKFYGELFMRADRPGGKPAKFILEISADHIGGSIGMQLDALEGIKGPLGFSDRFVVYSLKGSVAAKWATLLSTGAIDSFGLGGRFALDKDEFTCEMRLGANPTQTLVNIQAPKLDLPQLCKFIAAVMDKEIVTPDVNFFGMYDVQIYVSSGCSWFDTWYPKGFKYKGLIKLWDFQASMDAELSTSGFHCLTKIKGFELGPLKLTGALPGEQDASMEITLNPLKQSIYLSGRIEIFNLSCACFVDCQWMPNPKFVFDFELQWSAGLLIKVHAEMHERTKQNGGKDLTTGKEITAHPGGADWEIYALMEQSIIAQVKQGILSAIDSTHQAMEKGIKGAMDAVEREKEAYEKRCREAQAKLDAAYKAQQDEIDRLDLEIESAKTRLNEVKQSNEIYTANERAKCSATRAQAEKNRASRLENKAEARRRADEEKLNQERNKEWQLQEARNKRNNAKDTFFSKFGDADAAVQRALRELRDAEHEVDRLRWDADQLEHRISDEWWRIDLEAEWLAKRNAWLFARGGLLVYEGILRVANEVVDSPLFRELKEAISAAEDWLRTVGDQVQSALETAGKIAAHAFDELQKAITDEDFSFNNLMERANSFVQKAEEECRKYEEEAHERGVLLDKQKQKMLAEFNQVGLVALREAVEFARKNNIALIAAEKALAAFDALEKAAYTAIRDFVSATLDAMIDIQRVELKGIIRANKAEQETFQLRIEGQLGGKHFVFEEHWMPGKTHIFLAKVGLRAVSSITGANMDKEINLLDAEMKSDNTVINKMGDNLIKI